MILKMLMLQRVRPQISCGKDRNEELGWWRDMVWVQGSGQGNSEGSGSVGQCPHPHRDIGSEVLGFPIALPLTRYNLGHSLNFLPQLSILNVKAGN